MARPKGTTKTQQQRDADREARLERERLKALATVVPANPNLEHNGPTHGVMRNGRFYPNYGLIRARIHELTPRMLEIVADLAETADNGFLRLAAAKDILDRSLGRAMERTELNVTEDKTVNVRLTLEQRNKYLEIVDLLSEQNNDDNT